MLSVLEYTQNVHNIKDRIADKQHQYCRWRAIADAARNRQERYSRYQTHGVEHIHGLIQICRAERIHSAEKLNEKQRQQIIIAVL